MVAMLGWIMPEPLAMPVTVTVLPPMTNPARHGLGDDVGGHDGMGRVEPVVGFETGDGLRQSRHDFLDRQRLHDDAGGIGQHLFIGAAQQFRQGGAGGARSIHALLAGACIGVAGVHHQRADGLAGCEMFARHRHRRGAKTVLGEDAGDRRAVIQLDDQHVLAVGALDPGFRRAQLNARHGQKFARDGRRQFYRHVYFLELV